MVNPLLFKCGLSAFWLAKNFDSKAVGL